MRTARNAAVMATGAVLAIRLTLTAAEAPPPVGVRFRCPATTASAPAPAPAPNPAAAVVDNSLRRLPGSDGAFTLAQIRDGFGPADWYPGDHPSMPDTSRMDGDPMCAPAASEATRMERAVRRTPASPGFRSSTSCRR